MTELLQEAAIGASFYSEFDDSLSLSLGEVGCWPDSQISRGWSDAVDHLLRLRFINDDWDGEGSPAPSAEVLNFATNLARRMKDQGQSPPDRVLAGVNGTVFFEWYFPDCYQEVEVISPYDFEFRSTNK